MISNTGLASIPSVTPTAVTQGSIPAGACIAQISPIFACGTPVSPHIAKPTPIAAAAPVMGVTRQTSPCSSSLLTLANQLPGKGGNHYL